VAQEANGGQQEARRPRLLPPLADDDEISISSSVSSNISDSSGDSNGHG
jgi:hypothetical protein